MLFITRGNVNRNKRSVLASRPGSNLHLQPGNEGRKFSVTPKKQKRPDTLQVVLQVMRWGGWESGVKEESQICYVISSAPGAPIRVTICDDRRGA